MSRELLCRMKAYIQPFEKQLALLELASLAGSAPIEATGADAAPHNYRVRSRTDASGLIKRLAYWETVSQSRPAYTLQALREATVNMVRNGIPLKDIREHHPFIGKVPLPNRRALRYGTHGLHEYRGKFFPQLVQALANIGGVPSRGVVVDPMCGSGTTLVEAVLGGFRGLGADLNPLSVLMSRAKCELLKTQPSVLVRAYEVIRMRLLHSTGRRTNDLNYFHSLPESDQAYLTNWFSEQVLRDLDLIMRYIGEVTDPILREFTLLCVSNILRRVSWQKKDDLRVRREVRLDVELDPIREFLEEIGRSVRIVLALLYQQSKVKLGTARVVEADACQLGTIWRAWRGKVDVVITSPPYATALPYLDTDRLSLSYLGLLSRPEHRKRDQLMIGNREITDRLRREYWNRFEVERRTLPQRVSALISKIERLNCQGTVGFRRRNLAALLAKYFLDMRVVLASIRDLLKPGHPAFIVVGNNHTIAGGQQVGIQTAQLLAEVAESVGIRAEESIPMEMLVSRDIFKKNAVASESILCLRKPGQ